MMRRSRNKNCFGIVPGDLVSLDGVVFRHVREWFLYQNVDGHRTFSDTQHIVNSDLVVVVCSLHETSELYVVGPHGCGWTNSSYVVKRT
jgi:hypothetical protein